MALGVASGTAYAHFTSTASASGSVSVRGAERVTVTAIAGTTDLEPGSASGLSLEIANPNPYTVTITGIAEVGAAATVAVSGAAGCAGTNAGVSVPTASTLDVPVAPGTSWVTLPTAVVMADDSADACQGATFHVPVTVVVRRQ